MRWWDTWPPLSGDDGVGSRCDRWLGMSGLMLSLDDRARLLRLARRCLEARVHREPPPPIERGGGLEAPMGAFVSIHTHGELRGCLGRVETDRAIADHVAHLAAAVCDSDPRFPPLCAPELPHTDIEISVLTPEQEVHDAIHIELGRHGVLIEAGWRRGLLLPQVATEQGWDLVTFLDQTCLKAGIRAGAWRNGARIFVFEALVFKEAGGRR